MKKKVFSLIALLAVIFMPLAVKAEDSYFNAGDNITSAGEHNHSYFEAGNNIKSNANVNGISFVAGNTIDIKGKSEYAFVAGETVEVEGRIEKDLFAAGNYVRILKDATVLRDAYIGGNNVKIASNINGNVYVGGSVVELDNITINGDLHVACNTLNIADKTVVTGKVYINEGAEITGENKLESSGVEKYTTDSKVEFKVKASDFVISILGTIFTGIIVSLVFAKAFKKLDYKLSFEDVCKKSLYGLGVLVILPMLALLSFAVVVGFSVGVIILLLYVVSLMLSTIFTSAIVGHNIYVNLLKQKENLYAGIVIGVLVIKLLSLVPILGGFVAVVSFFYGLGVIAKLFLEIRK